MSVHPVSELYELIIQLNLRILVRDGGVVEKRIVECVGLENLQDL